MMMMMMMGRKIGGLICLEREKQQGLGWHWHRGSLGLLVIRAGVWAQPQGSGGLAWDGKGAPGGARCCRRWLVLVATDADASVSVTRDD